MTATLALIAAAGWLACALWRLAGSAPPSLRTAQAVLALVAGACGALHWSAIGDSRWLVGGALLAAGGVAGWFGTSRNARLAALALGLLGTALYGVASASPAPATRAALR